MKLRKSELFEFQVGDNDHNPAKVNFLNFKSVAMKPRKTELLKDVLVNSPGVRIVPEHPFSILYPKLEMVSYSDNAYDVTKFFACFEKFLTYTVFLPSFIVARHQMAELTLGGLPHPSKISCALTPLKHERNDPMCDPRNSQGDEKMQFLFLLLFALTFDQK